MRSLSQKSRHLPRENRRDDANSGTTRRRVARPAPLHCHRSNTQLKSPQREPLKHGFSFRISRVFKRIRGEQTNYKTVEYRGGATIRPPAGRARGRLRSGVLDGAPDGWRGNEVRSRSLSRLSQSHTRGHEDGRGDPRPRRVSSSTAALRAALATRVGGNPAITARARTVCSWCHDSQEIAA